MDTMLYLVINLMLLHKIYNITIRVKLPLTNCVSSYSIEQL